MKLSSAYLEAGSDSELRKVLKFAFSKIYKIYVKIFTQTYHSVLMKVSLDRRAFRVSLESL